MSLYIDKKYVNLVSTSLEKFKWKKVNLANCRCPLCGDSETNKNKARGYFFSNNDNYFYKCHNCGISYNIYKFLEIISPSLFKQYCLETFTDKDIKFVNEEEPIAHSKPRPDTLISSYKIIDSLSKDHKAIQFLESRKIPKNQWGKFAYTEHFSKFAKEISADYDLIDDERMLILIHDEHNKLIGVQGRSFGNVKPKYITLKTDEKIKLVYGLNRIDKSKPIFVVEGPIDSMFLNNSIACLGIGNFIEVRKMFPNEDLIFIVDNEPRSRTVALTMKTLIENNEKICIFPSSVKEKDINDMVLQGIDVHGMISESVYRGPSAMMAYNAWRKCT
jgi:hypothetical protein